MIPLVVLVVGIGALAYWASKGQHGPLAPTTMMGKVALALVVVAVLVGPITRYLFAGAPFGFAAFAMAMIARFRQGDRGQLLWLPIVAGAFAAVFPVLWLLGELIAGD
jgi:hypothetical protein